MVNPHLSLTHFLSLSLSFNQMNNRTRWYAKKKCWRREISAPLKKREGKWKKKSLQTNRDLLLLLVLMWRAIFCLKADANECMNYELMSLLKNWKLLKFATNAFHFPLFLVLFAFYFSFNKIYVGNLFCDLIFFSFSFSGENAWEKEKFRLYFFSFTYGEKNSRFSWGFHSFFFLWIMTQYFYVAVVKD